MIHELKTWPDYFQAIWDGDKQFELRKNDRNFKVGDELILLEYDPTKNEDSGRYIRADVSYILCGGHFGLDENHCIMSLSETKNYQ